MRSFISSSLLFALLLVTPGCLASSGDVGLAEGALDNEGPGPDTSCHVDASGGASGPIVDGQRDGNWCCGMAECNDRELCGDLYGHFIEACAACDYYQCDPGSGLGPAGSTGGGSGGPRGIVDVLGSTNAVLALATSTVRVDGVDIGILETVDPWVDRGGLRARDGQACMVRRSTMEDGVLNGGDCCGHVTCDDRLSCGRNYGRSVDVCLPCEDGACITQSTREASPFGR